MKIKNSLVIYQAPNGAIELRGDTQHETMWATQAQIADVFIVDRSVVTKHIKNIFQSHEVDQESNVQKMHIPNSDKPVTYYSLDIILAVGYRTNSSQAIAFRQWATKTLRNYIVKGYAINKNRVGKNYNSFIRAVDSIRMLLPQTMQDTGTILSLIQTFADTWISLRAYDEGKFKKGRATKKIITLTASDIIANIAELKNILIKKGEATDIFAVEKSVGSIEGIIGNVFQSFNGEDVYPSIEEKASHLLYFVVKNHPYIDGNKRSGAFIFVWFLKKMGKLNIKRLTPDTLTALTLLVAESNPKDKDKMTALVTMLLGQTF